MQQPTSLSLLEKARTLQDQNAWDQLHRMYSPLIKNWIRRFDILGVEVDDLTQDVLIIVCRKIAKFEHNGNQGAFRKWLRLIVVNCVREFWKTKRIRPRSGSSSLEAILDELSRDQSELTEKWNHEHDLFVMAKLMEKVRPGFDESTWLAFEKTAIEQQPATEVAQQLELNIASVYSAKSRILAKLRELAGDLLD